MPLFKSATYKAQYIANKLINDFSKRKQIPYEGITFKS